MIIVIKRNFGTVITYYINDNWLFLVGLILGFSVLGTVKIFKKIRSLKTENNVSKKKPETIKQPNPRGGDSTALAKIYDQCINDDHLYIVRNQKVAYIVRKLLNVNDSNKPIVISVALYLYTLALANSQKVLINFGNSQFIFGISRVGTTKFLSGVVSAFMAPYLSLSIAGVIGAGSLFALVLLTAAKVDCSEFMTPVSHSQTEVHYVDYPRLKENRVYIAPKENVKIYERVESNPSSEQTCERPSPIVERYKNRLANEQCEPKKKYVALEKRTKHFSDLEEKPMPGLTYEVEAAIKKVEKEASKVRK